MGMAGADLSQQILISIEKDGFVNSLEYVQTSNQSHQKIVGAIKSLESLGNVVNVTQKTLKSWECTEEGRSLVNDGSYEARLFNSLPKEGRTVADIKASFPNANIALGATLKNKWVKKEGEKIVPIVDSVSDQVQAHLSAITTGAGHTLNEKVKADYKKRKLIKEIDITHFDVSKGSEFTTSVSKQEAELTKDMIESGQWKSKSFKPFNFKAKGKLDQRSGHLHPLMQLRSEFRSIFLEMGFTEMPTNNFVESAFWDFDALFQPQQHPARDAHDTFYVAEPKTTLQVPQDFLERVSKVHSEGGYGSTGYQYEWSKEEAYKNLLRTHTTAVSARMLYKLGQEGFKPAKYFSIDRVFRNETLDATHLAEFHQVEGLVVDYGLNIRNLMGIISEFFEKIGITKIRFKPAYNPYTEPSMEIFSFHEGLQKWVEVGNSGIFRPEMLLPMGIPEGVSVIAWGLSLERPAMIMYGINNIREFVGPRVKMELIVDNPLCTIDKFRKRKTISGDNEANIESLTARQEKIVSQLLALQSKVSSIAKQMGVSLIESGNVNAVQLQGAPSSGVTHDIVITADPRRPPYSLRVLAKCLADTYTLSCMVHTHSTIKEVSEKLQKFWGNEYSRDRSSSEVCLRLVWRQEGDSPLEQMPALSVSPLAATQIRGENNIARYLTRLIEVKSSTLRLYENLENLEQVSLVDKFIDDASKQLVQGSSKEKAAYIRELNLWLSSRSPYLTGSSLSLADPFMLSTLHQLRLLESAPTNVQKWSKMCLNQPLLKRLL